MTINTYFTQKAERISWFAAELTHSSEVSYSLARRLCWSWLGLLSCLRVGWLSAGFAWPLLALVEQRGSFLPLIFQQASLGIFSWPWQKARMSKPNPVSTFQAFVCIRFAPIPLGKVSHMAELWVRVGEYQKCGCREGKRVGLSL